jgi:hypothetical protein
VFLFRLIVDFEFIAWQFCEKEKAGTGMAPAF